MRFHPPISIRAAAVLGVLTTALLPALAQRPVLTPHVPKIVTQGGAQRVGAFDETQTMKLVLSLPLRNQDALNALLADLYNPASPNYRQWLTPVQFDAQFGPVAQDYKTVSDWAESNGLTITGTSGNNRTLSVAGRVSSINRAFNITETSYHNNSTGREFLAPDREPTVNLSVPLLAISGLDTSNPKVNYLKKKPEPVSTPFTNFKPSAPETAITGSGPGNTYLPSDMRAAYYGTGTLTGTGQTVAIFSYDGYVASDLTLYTTKTTEKLTDTVTNVLVDSYPGTCEATCDDGEQILDIEQVNGMAPGLAGILFYESDSSITELNQMVEDDKASVITSSWGGGDFGPASDPYFLQMAAQGQTYFNATGDSGGFNGFTYYPPSLDPNIVQVGGTDLTTVSAGGAWKSETAWVDSGGGFFDPNITIPSWQTTSGVITATNKGSATLRNSPDMALEANFDNTTVINGTFESGYGGTSYATPRMAGYMALVNEQSVTNGTGKLGFINPALYEFGLSATAATDYHDITSGTAPSAEAPIVTYSAVAGYDLVTGWGSPNGTGLLNALLGPDFAISAPTVAEEVDRGSSTTVTITITPKNKFVGPPTFTVSTLPAGVTAAFGTPTATSVPLVLTATTAVTLSTSTITVTGTFASVSRSTTFQLNTGKRSNDDFTISGTAASVAQEGTGGSTITVKPGSGLAGSISLGVSGLPTGVTAVFSPATTITTSVLTFSAGITAVPGTYTVLVTGTTAGSETLSTPVALTITAVPSVLANGGFETGATTPWVFTSTTTNGAFLCNEECGFFQHSGEWFAYMNGFGTTDTDTLTQTVTITAGKTTAALNVWLLVYTDETSTTAKNDTFTIKVLNSSGTALATLGTFSNLNASSAYVLYSYNLSAYIGQTVEIQFQGVENNSKPTAFLLDDISVVVN